LNVSNIKGLYFHHFFLLTFVAIENIEIATTEFEFVFYTAAAVLLLVFNEEAQWLGNSIRKRLDNAIRGILQPIEAEKQTEKTEREREREPLVRTNCLSTSTTSTCSISNFETEFSLSSHKEGVEVPVLFKACNSPELAADDGHSFAVESSQETKSASMGGRSSMSGKPMKDQAIEPSLRNTAPPVRTQTEDELRTFAEHNFSDDSSTFASYNASSADSWGAQTKTSELSQQTILNIILVQDVVGEPSAAGVESKTDFVIDDDESLLFDSMVDGLSERGVERQPSIDLSHIFMSRSERRLAEMPQATIDSRAAVRVGVKVKNKLQRHSSFDKSTHTTLGNKISRNMSESGLKRH
jgi:hypothetical protein